MVAKFGAGFTHKETADKKKPTGRRGDEGGEEELVGVALGGKKLRTSGLARSPDAYHVTEGAAHERKKYSVSKEKEWIRRRTKWKASGGT